MTSLTVLCPNAHRCAVKTTPGKLLKEVLEEACMKQGYAVDEFELKFQRTTVDLSLPVRLSGLPNNATLEMVKKLDTGVISEVEVALQGNFGRKILKFPSTTTLRTLLEEFSKETGAELLQMPSESTVPAVGCMNNMWKGIPTLEKTTLKSIGIESGRTLLRYSQIELTAAEVAAMQQSLAEEEERKQKLFELYEKNKRENEERERLSAQYQKDVEERERLRLEEAQRITASPAPTPMETESEQTAIAFTPPDRLSRLQNILTSVESSLTTGAHDNLADSLMGENGRIRVTGQNDEPSSSTSTQPHFLFADFRFPDVPVATFGELMLSESENARCEAVDAPNRRALLFVENLHPQPSSSDSATAADEPDEFYELTPAELKKMQRELSEQSRQLNQQALLPKAFVEKRNKLRKLEAYRRTVIRFRLGESGPHIQALFLSAEPVSRIHEFFASILNQNAPAFRLISLRTRLESDATKDLIDASIAPKAVFDVHFDNAKYSADFMNTALLEQCDSPAARTISDEWLSVNTKYVAEHFTVAAEPETKKRVIDENRTDAAPPKRPSGSGSAMPKWFKH